MSFEETLSAAKEHLARRNFPAAWDALERAHVISQPDAFQHLRSHWWMLRCGWAEGDALEVIGQTVRVILSLPSSWLRLYPVGNTGRARAGLLHEP